jgi:magnesium-transporting ATPase (P-type)
MREMFHFLIVSIISVKFFTEIWEQRSFFLVVKGPAVDATDGFLCNPVMKMTMLMIIIIIIFVLFLVMEHRWNEIDRGKPKYSAKNLFQCHFVHLKSHMG